MSQLPPDAWQHLLRVTEDCVGCGICQRVCPSGSIRVENGRAVHTPGCCQTCLACIHACPRRGIQLTVPDRSGPPPWPCDAKHPRRALRGHFHCFAVP